MHKPSRPQDIITPQQLTANILDETIEHAIDKLRMDEAQVVFKLGPFEIHRKTKRTQIQRYRGAYRLMLFGLGSMVVILVLWSISRLMGLYFL